MRMFKIFSAAFALGFSALALLSCAAKTPGGITVRSATATSGRLQQTVEFSGVLAPNRTAVVSSRLSGLAGAVAADAGDKVKAGAVLLRIDTRELTAQHAVAQAAVQLVQDQTAEAKLGIDTAKANLDLAQKTFDRASTLLAAGAIAQVQFDDAQTKLQVALDTYQSAIEQYKLLSGSGLAQARAQEDLVRVQLSYGVVTSPIDGTVASRNIDPGEIVSPSSPLMTIVDASVLKLQGNVAQAIAALLKPGVAVKIHVDGVRAGDYQGTITQVGPVAASSGQFFPVIVSVKNDGRLMAGMTALASFDVKGPQSILVPRTALMSANGQAYAFILSQGRVSRRSVTLGLENATTVEVLGGLSEGDRVADSSVDTLQDGMEVRQDGGR